MYSLKSLAHEVPLIKEMAHAIQKEVDMNKPYRSGLTAE
jgi:hypothetical protein